MASGELVQLPSLSHAIVQRIPTLGTALSTLGLSRLSMTLSMLLNAGVEAKRSTKQAFLSTGNFYYISGMDRALDTIGRGESFGEAFAAANVFPMNSSSRYNWAN